jgi:hypothetical protein
MAYNEGYTTAELPPHNLFGNKEYYLLICSKKKKKTALQASKQNIFQLMLAGTSLGMTSILLFSRKIYSCFHWDCIVDAKRVDGVLLEMFLEKASSAQKW